MKFPFSNDDLKEIIEMHIKKTELIGEKAKKIGAPGPMIFNIGEIYVKAEIIFNDKPAWEIIFFYNCEIVSDKNKDEIYEYRFHKVILMDETGKVLKTLEKEGGLLQKGD